MEARSQEMVKQDNQKGEREMETKKITIKANTPMELEKQLDEKKERGGWEVQAVIKGGSPGVFEVTLSRDN